MGAIATIREYSGYNLMNSPETLALRDQMQQTVDLQFPLLFPKLTLSSTVHERITEADQRQLHRFSTELRFHAENWVRHATSLKAAVTPLKNLHAQLNDKTSELGFIASRVAALAQTIVFWWFGLSALDQELDEVKNQLMKAKKGICHRLPLPKNEERVPLLAGDGEPISFHVDLIYLAPRKLRIEISACQGFWGALATAKVTLTRREEQKEAIEVLSHPNYAEPSVHKFAESALRNIASAM